MLKNYFKVALRNLQKNKGFTSINIAGLAIGMATAILIGLWISDETSYDHYNPNYKKLAKIMITQTHGGVSYAETTISMPLGFAMQTKYRDLFKKVALVSFHNLHILAIGDKKISGRGVYAQEQFPSMFGLTIMNGSPGVLSDPSTIMIAKSLAVSLFGDENPVNKTILLDNNLNMKIGAVYEDLPENSSFATTTLLLPWTNTLNSYLSNNTNWQDHNGEGFVELNDHVSVEQATEKIKKVPTPFVKGFKEEALVYRLDKLHLYGEFTNGRPAGGRIRLVMLMGFIGAFVLLLACINFMNLSTARSSKRAREVGIRKTMGSLPVHLIAQFLIESAFLTLFAFVIALLLAQLSLSFFNNLAGKHIFIPYGNPMFWFLCTGFALFTGLLSGSYPAFYLSGFQPVKVLKGAFQGSRYNSIPRQVLVVMQFTVSLCLIIGTIIVYKQILFAKNRPTGYTRDRLVTMPMTTELNGHYDALHEELLRTGAVTDMAASSYPLSQFNGGNPMDWRGKDPGFIVFFRNVNVTPEFGRTVGWKITEGRDFSRAYADSNSIILSEAAVKTIGIPHPVGEIVKYGGKNRTVVGVVHDMLTNSPYDNIEPAIFLGDGFLSVITVRMKAGLPLPTSMAAIEKVFKKYNPGSPFIYQYNDEAYAKKFSSEERVANLSAVFAGMAIFISCLGMFGLASFVAEQRTKEIGVRKVLGATMFSLWKMLSTQFVRLVLISLCISIPLSYYGMSRWLQDYTYRDHIAWWIFAAAGFGILLITLITVSYQAIKAALMNPVNSLRSE